MPSKTKNSEPAAVTGVLVEFGRLREVLAMTHSEIPALLARERSIAHELGLGETETLPQQLADITTARESAARRRASVLDAVLAMETSLQSERGTLERERQRLGVAALAQFRLRYESCVAALKACWEEGRALAVALRCEVPMALPVKVVTSPVDSVARAQPILASDAVPPTVDPALSALAAEIDQVDGALALCNAIRQSAELEKRHHRLAVDRGAAVEYGGLFRVLATFRCQTDGLEFQPGELLDGSLIGGGIAHRLQAGKRYIEPVGMGA
jgi:hypothetical protein